MRLTVVGLGPGPVEWVTPAAVAALRASNARVFVRTRFHPAVDELLCNVDYESFDALYEQAATLEDLFEQMVRMLLAAGDRAVLAVPGDGAMGESVLERLRAADAELHIIPGVPLSVGALAAMHLPSNDGVQAVEATSLGGSGIDLHIELNPRWPAVVTGVFNPRIAADVKLALQRVYPAEHEVHLVRHVGLADQSVVSFALAELDRSAAEFDHLTHVVLPAVTGYVPTGSSHMLRAIVARLRAPEIGCPWDLEQTHRSLIPYAIEEAYEVVDAIQQDDTAGLADELGDLLLQVALHAELADQQDEFDWNDVVRTLSEKLVRRHPHVFGDVTVGGASDVVRNWDQLKAVERQHLEPPGSALDGIPKGLPSLKRAAEMARKASKSGFEWPTRQGTLDKVREELDELLAATTLADRREELGDLLWIIAKLGWDDGIDPEEALRAASQKFEKRFHMLEAIARERGWSRLGDHSIDELQSAWSEAKARTR